MWSDIGELRNLSNWLQGTSISLVFVSGFLQVGKYVVDRREKALSVIEQHPTNQAITSGSATVELIEDSNRQIA
jgi:hypothetical protein